MKKYYTGSLAFFEGMDGFNPSDIDHVAFEKVGTELCHRRIGNQSDFIWDEGLSKEDIIKFITEKMKHNAALCVVLVPEVAEKLGVTIDDLKNLKDEFAKIDAKHQYLDVIREAYIANDSFTLTDTQRLAAFEEYKRERGLM